MKPSSNCVDAGGDEIIIIKFMWPYGDIMFISWDQIWNLESALKLWSLVYFEDQSFWEFLLPRACEEHDIQYNIFPSLEGIDDAELKLSSDIVYGPNTDSA